MQALWAVDAEPVKSRRLGEVIGDTLHVAFPVTVMFRMLYEKEHGNKAFILSREVILSGIAINWSAVLSDNVPYLGRPREPRQIPSIPLSVSAIER